MKVVLYIILYIFEFILLMEYNKFMEVAKVVAEDAVDYRF